MKKGTLYPKLFNEHPILFSELPNVCSCQPTAFGTKRTKGTPKEH